MAVSPFTFYRGAAAVMAADLGAAPRTKLRVQLCGDAHLSNFGIYRSPERSLVFDLNDFDETLPGPFEWDTKRLAASFVIAGRSLGWTRSFSHRALLYAMGSYRLRMGEYARAGALEPGTHGSRSTTSSPSCRARPQASSESGASPPSATTSGRSTS